MTKRVGILAAAFLAAAMALHAGPAAAQQQGAASVEPYKNPEIANLIGLSVWSTDGKELGVVLSASSGADGKVAAIYIAVGSFLGIGERNVEIPADEFVEMGDRLQLSLTAQEVEALPDAMRHS